MTDLSYDQGTLAQSFAQSCFTPNKKPQTKRPSPVTLRLTIEERAKLEELAQGMTLSAYIRACVLHENIDARRRSSKRTVVKDEAMLTQILGLLGQSRIASNLNQLSYDRKLVTAGIGRAAYRGGA